MQDETALANARPILNRHPPLPRRTLSGDFFIYGCIVSITTFDEIKKLYTESTDNNIMDTYISYSHKTKTKNKTIKIKFGRLYVNLLLPDDYELIDEPITKKVCKRIITSLVKSYDGPTISKTIQKINEEMFVIATTNPITFDINSFIVPDGIVKKKDKLIKNLNDNVITDNEFSEELFKLSQELLEHFKIHSEGFADIIESGAKVSLKDIIVFLLSKGKVTSIIGVEKTVQNCLNDGFNLDEFFKSAAQARLAYYIRSSGTALPGALSRILAFSNSQTELSNKQDCKTTRYIKLHVTDKNFKLIQGRYYHVTSPRPGLKVINKDSNIIGETINLRSPIYCKDKNGICNICYGDLKDQLSTKYIGLITSSIINNVGVGAYMSARHKTSLITTEQVDFTKDLI